MAAKTKMTDQTETSLTSLFHRLCELSFLHEAATREDTYSKIRYTKSRRKKLQNCLYGTLFSELQAPWAGKFGNRHRGVKQACDVYELIAVKVFNLRLRRQFDKADLLEYYCTKWKSLEGSLRSTVDPSEPSDQINEPLAILRFIVALSDTAEQEPPPLLGYQNDLYCSNNAIPKEICSLLPEGPLLNTDSYKLRHKGLLENQYVLYSRNLFESAPTLEYNVSSGSREHPVFPDIMAPGQGRNRFFAIQESGEDKHDKKTRLTMFGALSHGYTDDMKVVLGLPDLPTSTDKTFGISTLRSSESPDDEGFHELSDSSATSSQINLASESSHSSMNIWMEALKLPTQKFYTWEMEGRGEVVTDRPYITEAGPDVFNKLYNLISRQVSYIAKTPSQYRTVHIRTLVNHSLDVLIGVPTSTFPNNPDSQGFIVNPDVRMTGCSPESLHTCLSKLAAIGTTYVRLVGFISHKEQTGGLVLHAFLGGLRNYLQCYRGMVLSIDAASVQSPYQLSVICQSLGKQIRFLSEVCMSYNQSGPSGSASFPTGVKLLSYLYKLCLDHSSTDHYPVLLSLLKHSCAPYILFVQHWVFQGLCHDVYEEFIIEVDDQFLAYRDKHFWSNGFVISEKDRLDCVPMFLSELANDIFVCGKSINLMKLCNPGHFLCDSGVSPPKMEVTFSMSKLKAIDQNCTDYINAMDDVANAVKQKRLLQARAIEDAKEKALMEERHRAEKALAEVTGLINQVKEAIDSKKKADLQMLKEQMEEAMKKRQLDKEREDELDNQYMVDALNRAAADEELRERARQELIDYYQKLTDEMDRREERAQWKIKRLHLNKARVEFFAKDRVKLETLQNELAQSQEKDQGNDQNEVLSVEAKDSEQRKLQNDQKGNHPTSNENFQSTNSGTSKAGSSAPSPSIVSLIASGVKTDALVHHETKNSLNISSSSVADSGQGTLGPTEDLSESNTLRSLNPIDDQDGDDTDISVASTISASEGRKKWPKEVKTDDYKEQDVSTRRTWEPDDSVRLAEAQLPHGHPSQSSIQFSLYADKTLSVDAPSSSHPIPKHGTPNPSNSSVQEIMYANKKGVIQDAKFPSSPVVHSGTPNPSDSSIQGLIYPSADTTPSKQDSHSTLSSDIATDTTGGATALQTDDSTHKELSMDDPVLSDFVHSLSKGVSDISRNYPSHATMKGVLEGVSESTVKLKDRSSIGHPTDSTAQSIMYQGEQTMQTPLGRRSLYGHPSDTQLDSTDSRPKQSLTQKTRRQWGHPSDSQLDQSLSTPNAPSRVSPRNQTGHPSDSQLDQSLTTSNAVTQYTTRNQWGHPSDSQIDTSLSAPDVSAPVVPTSQWGHPSDSQLNKPLSISNVSVHTTPRSEWGHPSDSKMQNLFTSQVSVSDNKQPIATTVGAIPERLYPENTRGTPPVDSLKDVLYPVSEDDRQGGVHRSSRGHEPAVKITKLMYPEQLPEERGPDIAKPLEFEDIWIASEVQSMQDDFSVLDKQPVTDLLKSALSGIPIIKDDDNNDDTDGARLMSLPVLMRRSVTAPLVAQISLVNTAVVQYFLEDLKLQSHFEVFRKFLFMEDGEFALSLSDQLFEKVSSGISPQELCSPTTMNTMVNKALQLSVYADKNGFEQRLSFALKTLPDVFNMNDIGTLDFLELRYRVPWPVNIIITENSIVKYNKVFSFMLRLKRVAWVLEEIWFHLKHIGFSRHAAGSPQLRQLQLFRHEMLHFLQNIDGYLSNQILNVTWAEFQQELTSNVRDLDDLHHRHTEYLNKAVFRSLLSKKAAPVMKIIHDMFSLVLKFRTQLLSCPWKQEEEGHVLHPRFDVMCATHRAFKEYSGFLFTILTKLVRRGYQAHLQDFLLRLNFNDFYKTS